MKLESTVLILVLALVFAGCVQPGAAVEPAAAEDTAAREEVARSPLLQELKASTPPAPADENATAASWWVARVAATPEGALGGFWWDVPADARVDWQLNDEFSSDEQVIALEVAPIFPAGKESAIVSWGLMAFDDAEDGGGLFPGGGYAYLPIEADFEMPASTAPGFATLWNEGARVPLLVFAQSTEPMEFAVAFRFLDHDPEMEEKPVPTPAEFLAARAGSPGVLVGAPGAGFAFSFYDQYCFGGFPVGLPTCFEMMYGDVEVEGATGGTPGPFSVLVSAPSAFPRGWAMTSAGFFELGVGATHWSGDAQARGHAIDGEGVQVSAYPTILTPGPSLVSWAGVFAVGEGDGDADVRFAVDAASYSGMFRVVDVGKVELGSTIEELFGEKAFGAAGKEGELPLSMRQRAADPRPPTYEDLLARLFAPRV